MPWTFLAQSTCMYSSGQNKVPTAEWESRLIVAQSENCFRLRATLVAVVFLFFFQALKYAHTRHCILPPGIVALLALCYSFFKSRSASYSQTIILAWLHNGRCIRRKWTYRFNYYHARCRHRRYILSRSCVLSKLQLFLSAAIS